MRWIERLVAMLVGVLWLLGIGAGLALFLIAMALAGPPVWLALWSERQVGSYQRRAAQLAWRRRVAFYQAYKRHGRKDAATISRNVA